MYKDYETDYEDCETDYEADPNFEKLVRKLRDLKKKCEERDDFETLEIILEFENTDEHGNNDLVEFYLWYVDNGTCGNKRYGNHPAPRRSAFWKLCKKVGLM